MLNIYHLVNNYTELFKNNKQVAFSDYYLAIKRLQEIGIIKKGATFSSNNFDDFAKCGIPVYKDMSYKDIKNCIISHERRLKSARKLYILLDENTSLFKKDKIVYEDILSEIQNLKNMGIISKHNTYKPNYDILIEAGFPLTNHKIVNIELVENNNYVYDLVLDEIHNFGIMPGIYVHNCVASLFNAIKHEEEYSNGLSQLDLLTPVDNDFEKENILKIAAGMEDIKREMAAEQKIRNDQMKLNNEVTQPTTNKMSNWIL